MDGLSRLSITNYCINRGVMDTIVDNWFNSSLYEHRDVGRHLAGTLLQVINMDIFCQERVPQFPFFYKMRHFFAKYIQFLTLIAQTLRFDGGTCKW